MMYWLKMYTFTSIITELDIKYKSDYEGKKELMLKGCTWCEIEYIKDTLIDLSTEDQKVRDKILDKKNIDKYRKAHDMLAFEYNKVDDKGKEEHIKAQYMQEIRNGHVSGRKRNWYKMSEFVYVPQIIEFALNGR